MLERFNCSNAVIGNCSRSFPKPNTKYAYPPRGPVQPLNKPEKEKDGKPPPKTGTGNGTGTGTGTGTGQQLHPPALAAAGAGAANSPRLLAGVGPGAAGFAPLPKSSSSSELYRINTTACSWEAVFLGVSASNPLAFRELVRAFPFLSISLLVLYFIVNLHVQYLRGKHFNCPFEWQKIFR